MELSKATKCWEETLKVLRNNYTEAIYKTAFSALTVYYCDEKQLVLLGKNTFDCNRVNSRYNESLLLQVCQQFGCNFEKVVAVTPDQASNYLRTITSVSLKNEYTFDSFVTGQSNLLAYTAAMAVADEPGKKYNPLFLWGPPGLGKTHLLNAIGHHVRENNPSAVVRYYSSEQFLIDVIEGIANKRQSEMREYMRSANVFIIDDIQAVIDRASGSGSSILTEFFNIFNELYSRGDQIIISADQPPETLPIVEERMRSRFLSGITVPIDKPDFQTRCAILLNKAQRSGYTVERDAIERIAAQVNTNIRELEGALKNADFIANTLGTGRVTVDIVTQMFGNAPVPSAVRTVNEKTIIESVSRLTNVAVDDILSKSRVAKTANARHMAIYLISKILNVSDSQIGRIFMRDHSTIGSSMSVAERLIETDPLFAQHVNTVIEENRL